MPRRTNPFQRIIYLIEQQLAPLGASVEQSIELANRAGSKPTEVDILITLPGPQKSMRVGVECQNERRGATVEWIRELWGKYRLLDVDRVVAVAGYGFSKDALKEAKFLGINALTIDEAESFDWSSRLRLLEKILVFDVLYEHIGTSVELTGSGEMPTGFARDTRAIRIALPRKTGYEHLGDQIVTLHEFIDRVLSEPHADEMLAKLTESNPTGEGWLGARFPIGAGICDIQDRRYSLTVLHLHFRRAATTTEVPLTHAAYDGAAVAVGSGGDKGSTNVALVHLEDAEIGGKLRMIIDGVERILDLPDMTQGL